MFNRCYDRDNDVNNTFIADNMDVDMNMDYMNNNMAMPMPIDANMQLDGGIQAPIIEPMQQRVINRTIIHNVPQDCPQMQDYRKAINQYYLTTQI